MDKLTYELLDPDRLINTEEFNFIENFLKATGRTQIGWHYIIDMTWIYSIVKDWPRSYKILDAGGGFGPIQFLLAELGFSVTNIDMQLTPPPPYSLDRYRTTFDVLDSFTTSDYMEHLNTVNATGDIRETVKKSFLYRILKTIFYRFTYEGIYMQNHNKWRKSLSNPQLPVGNIKWLRGNLCNIPEIPNGYFNAIVSLSSIEHIPLEQLNQAMLEIHRILKPEAKWAVTTSATERNNTWFHEQSHGYCYSLSDISKYFGAWALNNDDPSKLIQKYKNCCYLKDNLANFYKISEKNGMPWGIWDPQYIPVGLHC